MPASLGGWRAALLVALLIGGRAARAQDAHYASIHYAPTASLLGGAVIGSVEGLSSVYYNPARLATLTTRSAFTVSAHVFDWETLAVDDGVRPGRDLTSTRSGLHPSLLAGALPMGGERHHWAYSYLTRQNVENDIEAALYLGPPDVPATAFGSLRLENHLHDDWSGLTWAYRAAEGAAVGFSLFTAFRAADRRAELLAAASAGGSDVTYINLSGYEFWHLRLLARLGAWHRVAGIDLGLTLTTPSVSLLGRGRTEGSRVAFGVTEQANEVLSAQRSGLDATFRSPLSLGAGAAASIGATRLHVSGEWFAGLDRYVVVAAPGNDEGGFTFGPPVVHEARSVLNWSIGLEQALSTRLHGFAGAGTDRSAATGNDVNVGTGTWDTSMVTAGIRFDHDWAELVVGAGYAFGETPFTALKELSGVDVGFPNEAGEATTLRYRNWRVICGVQF